MHQLTLVSTDRDFSKEIFIWLDNWTGLAIFEQVNLHVRSHVNKAQLFLDHFRKNNSCLHARLQKFAFHVISALSSQELQLRCGMQIEERGRDRSRRDRVQTWSTKKIGQWTAVVQNIETSKNNIFVKIAI